MPPLSTTPVAYMPPVPVTPAANFATGTAGIIDTVANLPRVSMILAANNGKNIRILTP